MKLDESSEEQQLSPKKVLTNAQKIIKKVQKIKSAGAAIGMPAGTSGPGDAPGIPVSLAAPMEDGAQGSGPGRDRASERN